MLGQWTKPFTLPEAGCDELEELSPHTESLRTYTLMLQNFKYLGNLAWNQTQQLTQKNPPFNGKKDS